MPLQDTSASIVSMKLDEFRGRFPPHAPRRAPANEDELRRLEESDGVRLVGAPPLDVPEEYRRVPEHSGDNACHLWVFHGEEIPHILEHAPVAEALESGVVKHTNLTGGKKASCGGELWLDPIDDDKLYVNGCSGRYGPRTPVQLGAAVEVFEQLGYKVKSFGWDDEANAPERVLWPSK